MTGAHLSPELRKQHNRRSIQPRKGDKVKIMRGQYKGRMGKIANSYPSIAQCEVEGVERDRVDGTKVRVSLANSNLLVIELTHDSKRSVFKSESRKRAKKVEAVKSPTAKPKTRQQAAGPREAKLRKEAEPKAKSKPAKKAPKTEVKK